MKQEVKGEILPVTFLDSLTLGNMTYVEDTEIDSPQIICAHLTLRCGQL